MSLGYYTPTLSGPAAKYSGDISSWTWTQSGQGANSYGFAYDGAHRLTGGQYYSGSTATNALSEKGISYDRNGNITALTRYNSSGTATSLAYAYTGNWRNTFSYDANGNVTSDITNSLQSSYNLLNLPAQIKSGSTVKANYTYLSDGTKAAAYTSASAGKDYVGSFTYTRGSGGSKTLESVAFGGGRIRKNGSSYLVDYHVTDHLGSVRAIVTNGSITEQDDYYPFGTRHPNGLTQLTENRWRFGGKEEQDAFGIAYSDFGARFLAPGTASWTAIDPMAEKYYSVSPYAYCNNSPVRFVDPEGMRVVIWYQDNGKLRFYSYSGGQIKHENSFVNAVIEAYHYNNANWINAGYAGKSPLSKLIERNESVNIMNSNATGDRFNDSYNVIYRNPATGLASNGFVISPATGLAHEADHANHFLDSPQVHRRMTDQYDPVYGNAEERRVITGSEQQSARANGEISGQKVTRKNHGGKSVIVKGVTSTEIDEKATSDFQKKQSEYELYKYSQD